MKLPTFLAILSLSSLTIASSASYPTGAVICNHIMEKDIQLEVNGKLYPHHPPLKGGANRCIFHPLPEGEEAVTYEKNKLQRRRLHLPIFFVYGKTDVKDIYPLLLPPSDPYTSEITFAVQFDIPERKREEYMMNVKTQKDTHEINDQNIWSLKFKKNEPILIEIVVYKDDGVHLLLALDDIYSELHKCDAVFFVYSTNIAVQSKFTCVSPSHLVQEIGSIHGVFPVYNIYEQEEVGGKKWRATREEQSTTNIFLNFRKEGAPSSANQVKSFVTSPKLEKIEKTPSRVYYNLNIEEPLEEKGSAFAKTVNTVIQQSRQDKANTYESIEKKNSHAIGGNGGGKDKLSGNPLIEDIVNSFRIKDKHISPSSTISGHYTPSGYSSPYTGSTGVNTPYSSGANTPYSTAGNTPVANSFSPSLRTSSNSKKENSHLEVGGKYETLLSNNKVTPSMLRDVLDESFHQTLPDNGRRNASPAVGGTGVEQYGQTAYKDTYDATSNLVKKYGATNILPSTYDTLTHTNGYSGTTYKSAHGDEREKYSGNIEKNHIMNTHTDKYTYGATTTAGANNYGNYGVKHNLPALVLAFQDANPVVKKITKHLLSSSVKKEVVQELYTLMLKLLINWDNSDMDALRAESQKW